MTAVKDLLKKTDDCLSKIHRLTEKHEKALSALKIRDEKIESLRIKVSACDERIQMLEQEVASLKLGTLVNLSGQDSKEIRKKLNNYLRELDEVIAKLSSED